MDALTGILAIRTRQMRIERKWTQEELADRVGISARYVGEIERCRASPTVNILGRLAVAFDVDAAELLARPAGPRRRTK